jgi:hypothetical protein
MLPLERSDDVPAATWAIRRMRRTCRPSRGLGSRDTVALMEEAPTA